MSNELFNEAQSLHGCEATFTHRPLESQVTPTRGLNAYKTITPPHRYCSK